MRVIVHAQRAGVARRIGAPSGVQTCQALREVIEDQRQALACQAIVQQAPGSRVACGPSTGR